MKTIIWFEIKKILDRKINRVAMIFGILLLVFSDCVMIANESISANDGQMSNIIENLKSQTETESALTSELSEDFLTGFLRDYQEKAQGEVNWSIIKPYSNMYRLIAQNSVNWNEEWEWDDLNRIDTENGIGFYDRRNKKIETMLNADYSYGNYSDEEKGYWRTKAEALDLPYKWGSTQICNITWNSVCNLFFMLMVISICIAPVFAGETYYHTDSLIFSSKYGRESLIRAKVAAAFLYTFAYMVACVLPSLVINISLLGVKGWNLPVQLWNTIIPYRLNAFEACALNFMVMVLQAALLTGISLLISAVCNNQIAVLAVDMLMIFGAIFIPFSKTSGLWNHILYLMPIHTFDMRQVLKLYNSYQIAGYVLSYVDMIFIVYVLLTAVCTYVAGRSFRKQQVG